MSNTPVDNPRTPLIIFIMAFVFIALVTGYQIENPSAGALAIPLGEAHEAHR